MRNRNTRDLAEMSLLIAIVIIMAWIPYLGYISIGPISVTLLHIPVLIAGLRYGFKGGLILGTAFGLSSMIIAIIRPMAATDVLFINPLVSVLPRILFGLLAGCGKPLIQSRGMKKAIAMIWCVFCTCVHTVLVMGSLYLVHYQTLLDLSVVAPGVGIGVFILGFMTIALIEGTVGGFVAAPVVMILNRRNR